MLQNMLNFTFLKKRWLILFILPVVGIVGATILFAINSTTSVLSPIKTIYASDNACPSNYTLQQCYDYIQKQLKDLNNKQTSLKTKLNTLSRQQKNAYNDLLITQTKVKQLRIDIKKLELSMYKTQLDINTLQQMIKSTQQEISQNNRNLQIRKNKIFTLVRLKYTMSAFPIYYYVKGGDVLDILEYITLINYMLTQQKAEIRYIELLKKYIQQKQSVLNKKQQELAKKQESLEKENKNLISKQKALEKEEAQQKAQLAQIQAAEAAVRAEVDKVKILARKASENLQNIINQMGDSLPSNGRYVAKGAIIGWQGHTGCAFGSHLHFALLKWNGSRWVYVNPVNEGLFKCTGGSCTPYASYLVPTSQLATPLPSPLITQNYWAQHHAFDLVSTTAGNQTGARYYAPKGSISCNKAAYGWFGLRGEGAPVFAIYGGTYSGYKRDWWGANYAYVIHTINGRKYLSLYVHLRTNSGTQ